MSLKRQTDILQAVRARGSLSITELAARLDVSTETIRRNIQPMLESGALLRFHGGVMAPEAVEEPPFQRRMAVNNESKWAVAALARDRIRDGDSLILDNGTTSAYVAEALGNHSRLTVVTHSAPIAHRLAARNGNRVFMAGGELGGEDAAAFGPAVLDFIRQFHVRYALISVGGITRGGELGDFHLFEAEFARAAMAQAEEAWVIADRSKFGREAPVKVCGLSEVDLLLSDGAPPPEFAARCEEAGVRVVTPDAAAAPA
ncbi:DeoR family transcriptional regulator [Methylopila jiangsuensis]|uniref:DeoR family transcriptional regulator n=1 Tax=Methylopila jiangsuensis TaxID=586230 RepID=A0A9W6N363_9HYPH|nr:DeoR/GlpR family DNA-binding transcription regulator [Methylopila jiangsuensis]MDR6285990.1 DeoR family glycerol-3-phosphate regulon repressor [Methylopila jiangsuensis]GLK75747.1 DeoR family transcriptional regulator [Methylopila jiangsuensis]